jgi:hypothetical protein
MIQIIVLVIILAGLSLGMPNWWWIMLAPFAWGMGHSGRIWTATWKGALAGALVWGGWSVWLWKWGGADIIVARVGDALRLGSPVYVVLSTATIAAVAAGVAAAAGSSVRCLFRN